MTEIISLMSKPLSELNMLPFHNNKVDALQFLRNKPFFRNVLQTGKLDFTTLKKCNKLPFFVPVFVQIVPLSISHAEHNLISSGFVKAGETAGVRVPSLRAGSPVAFPIQSLFTLLHRAHVLELLPLEVLNTSQPCAVTGTACPRAQLMLHYFSLTFGILNSFTVHGTLPIHVLSNNSIRSFSPCFWFVVLQMILFIYNELLHLICQDLKIGTCFLAVHFHCSRIFLFNFNIESDYFQFFLA